MVDLIDEDSSTGLRPWKRLKPRPWSTCCKKREIVVDFHRNARVQRCRRNHSGRWSASRTSPNSRICSGRLEQEQEIKHQLQHQLVEMQQDVLHTHEIIARSGNMVKALQRALKASKVDSSILITGESGVGKG